MEASFTIIMFVLWAFQTLNLIVSTFSEEFKIGLATTTLYVGTSISLAILLT